MKVEIWSDVVCPWCYIGKRRFEAALSAFEHRDSVEVTWRAFELDPSAPPRHEGPYVDRLAAKYGMSVEEAQGYIDHMVATGAEAGVALRFERARPGNTFDAHRLLHLALQQGAQDALQERLLAATFVEGAPVGDREVLLGLAAGAGLGAAEARLVLDGDGFAAEVRADEERARDLGITGVPFFLIGGAYGVDGAHPPEVLLAALEKGWAGASPSTSQGQPA